MNADDVVRARAGIVFVPYLRSREDTLTATLISLSRTNLVTEREIHLVLGQLAEVRDLRSTLERLAAAPPVPPQGAPND